MWATLVSALESPNQMQVVVLRKWIVPPLDGFLEEFEQAIATSQGETKDCRQPIVYYMCYGILSENLRRRTEIRRQAPCFIYYKIPSIGGHSMQYSYVV